MAQQQQQQTSGAPGAATPDEGAVADAFEAEGGNNAFLAGVLSSACVLPLAGKLPQSVPVAKTQAEVEVEVEDVDCTTPRATQQIVAPVTGPFDMFAAQKAS